MFFNNTKSKPFLLCDIGSGSVGLALVDSSESPVKILHSTRTLTTFPSTATFQDKQKLILETLNNSGKLFSHSLKPIFEKKKMRHVHDVHIVFSSPWYISKTTVEFIKKDRDFIIDNGSLGQVIDEEEKKFENEVAQSLNTRFSHSDIHMIEREVMRVLINGYETDNPFYKKVRQIDFCLYMSIIPYDFLNNLDEGLRGIFHAFNVRAHSFPLVCFQAIAKIFPHEHDFIHIDAGGETTDVTIIRNNAIEVSQSFPYGRNEAVKSIAQELQVPFDVAVSYLQMMKDGTLEVQIEAKLKSQIERVGLFWFERLQSIQKEVQSGDSFKRIFLTAKDDFAFVLTEILKTKGQCEVFPLNKEILKNHVVYEENSGDASLSLGAFAVSQNRR